jgi:uncharacterized membrane protein
MSLPWSLMSLGILATIVLLGVLAVWKILEDRRSGFPAKDERTRKITGRAATYTFYIGSYFMIALMLANIVSREFTGLFLIDWDYALVASILVQSLVFGGLRWYFNRKGDYK